MADTFDADMLAVYEGLITAYSAALLAIVTNGAQSYTLDTGQDRQTVTKLDVKWMQSNLTSAINQRTILKTRCTGSGVTNVGPAW